MADPIILDTNILKDVSRGNQAVADALNRYIKAGTRIVKRAVLAIAILCLTGGHARAEVIAYYFEMNDEDVAGFVSYEWPPMEGTIVASGKAFVTVGYPLATFSFTWNGEQYLAVPSADRPLGVGVRNGTPMQFFDGSDRITMEANVESAGGGNLDVVLQFEHPNTIASVIESTDLPPDLTTWPFTVNGTGPRFSAYSGNSRVLNDYNVAFGFLPSRFTQVQEGDAVWLGGDGDFEEAAAWSIGAVPSVFDKVWFSLARPGTKETISFDRDAVVNTIGFLDDRDLEFDLNHHSLIIGSQLVLGTAAGSSDKLTVDGGTISALTFVVGDAGKGDLTLSNGANASSLLVIASQAGSEGSVTIDGPASKWEALYGSTIIVGKEGVGRLSVINGGEVNIALGINGGLVIGQETGSTGSVAVTGAGSQLLVDSRIVAGFNGKGDLRVSDGGLVAAPAYTNGVDLEIGGPFPGKAGSTGNVIVDGAGSKIIARRLTVGEHGSGSLTVSGGGEIEITSSVTIANWTEEGVLTVQDEGSMMLIKSNVVGSFDIGKYGKGSLNIRQGGEVWNQGNALVGVSILGDPSIVTVEGNGSLWRSYLISPDGEKAGRITIQNDSRLIVRDNAIVETSAMAAQLGGEIILDSGHLEIDGLALSTGGKLLGNGTIAGSVVNGGVIAPGNSPGRLDINGDYTQLAEGLLSLDVSGLMPHEHDILAVTGLAVLDGTLEVMFDGFAPRVGDSITFLESGPAGGSFASIMIRGLAPGWTYSYDAASLTLTSLNDASLAFLILGDANGDGKVDLADFAILKQNFGNGTTIQSGDFNGDGKVDLEDFSILKKNFGNSEAAAVPEPSASFLAIVSLVAFVGCAAIRVWQP